VSISRSIDLRIREYYFKLVDVLAALAVVGGGGTLSIGMEIMELVCKDKIK
jgi:hypothetical protein